MAVVGAPDELLGEVPVAFVSATDGGTTDKEALLAFCHSRLPAYKVPARFVIRRELPKLGAVGKIDKALLREEARTVPVSAATEASPRLQAIDSVQRHQP